MYTKGDVCKSRFTPTTVISSKSEFSNSTGFEGFTLICHGQSIFDLFSFSTGWSVMSFYKVGNCKLLLNIINDKY